MKNYINEVMRTASISQSCFTRLKGIDINLLHGALGISTEAGELLDQIKKHIFYGSELDIVNIKEELSDVFWYVALICNEFGWAFDEIQELNIRKLQARYPEKFTEEKALNRDLEKERNVLEKYNGFVCSICGEYQFSTDSGDVCKNGHGGAEGIAKEEYDKKVV